MNDIPTVLIVDDEPSARLTTEMLLLPEGYELAFATSGPDAFAQLEGQALQPDVILLDVMMPDMNGFEVCRCLKESQAWQHIPIILVTALDAKADLARGLEAGADDFVNKPVNGLELRARVRSMLRIKRRHDELQATLQLREDLSNMIMHDIRRPLATIAVYSDLLEEALPTVEGREELNTIRQEANRLSSYLTDMLMLAKMEQEQLVLHRTPVDVSELVQTVCQSYEPLAALRDVHLALELAPAPCMVALDANLWQRVLDNLLSNALKFSPPRSTIGVEVGTPAAKDVAPPKVQIRVKDEGPGVPPEHRETIFDKFRIVASGRRDVTQVGLGLAFCRLVVEAHGGRIFVCDGEPRGAVFIVEL